MLKVRTETAGAVAYFIYDYWHRSRGVNRDWGYMGRITDITERLDLLLDAVEDRNRIIHIYTAETNVSFLAITALPSALIRRT